MATRQHTTKTANGSKPVIRSVTADQIRARLDRRARKLLGISGDEFMRRFEAGELEYSTDEIELASLAWLVR